MSDSSTLARWLPAMLGGLVAVGVAMAYELELIEREVPPCVCDDEPETAELEPRPANPLYAGARRHPAGSREADPALALEDRVAALEAQNELLAEQAVTGEIAYYGHTQAELEAMARHCDVRTDYPVRLDQQDAEDVGLGASEREAYQRAIAAFAEQEAELYRGLLRELKPELARIDELSLGEVRRQLTRGVGRARRDEDGDIQRHVAEERAGLREPPMDPSELSVYNRYHRYRFNAGDRFAEILADELGDDRATELRSAFQGWPGARTRQFGCE